MPYDGLTGPIPADRMVPENGVEPHDEGRNKCCWSVRNAGKCSPVSLVINSSMTYLHYCCLNHIYRNGFLPRLVGFPAERPEMEKYYVSLMMGVSIEALIQHAGGIPVEPR